MDKPIQILSTNLSKPSIRHLDIGHRLKNIEPELEAHGYTLKIGEDKNHGQKLYEFSWSDKKKKTKKTNRGDEPAYLNEKWVTRE